MKRVIVFGGSGFIGSHLIGEFISKNYVVINFDLWDYYADQNIENYIYYQGNILNNDNLYKNFWYPDIDIIVNLIALSSISECNEKPVAAFQQNVNSNIRILQFIESNFKDTAKPLYIYSSSLYSQSNKSGAYGLSKKHSEDWIKYFANKYCIPYLILRYGTVYGSGAQEENSIRKIIEYALKAKVISYYGTGEETRNYIHVKDVAKNTLEIINKLFRNRTINIMGNESIKSVDLINLIKDILGEEYKVKFGKGHHPDHYIISPYFYNKELVTTYISEECIDLGIGLLEVIKELDNV